MGSVRFRVRTLMVAVGLVAVLLWAGMMGLRSYDYSQRARAYRAYERGWRQSATRDRLPRGFSIECADYYAELAGKYRRATWQPWLPVAPDPYAPGVEEYLEQQRREAAKGRDDL